MQQLEGGIVEELLVDNGEAAEVMAAQERTFRARAGRVVQPSWPRSSSSPSPFVKSRISGNAAADAERTLSAVTPYRCGVPAQPRNTKSPAVKSLNSRSTGSSRLAAQRDVVERTRVAAPVAGTVMDSRSTREAAWWATASG